MKHMPIAHRRFNVAMTQEFLSRSNIVIAFEHVHGNGMPDGVARGPFGEPNLRHSVSDGFLRQ